MNHKYSYNWYIEQFENAKETAEKFILSVDEVRFLQPPAQERWSVAECYNHLVKFGNLYLKCMEPGLTSTDQTAGQSDKEFRPRWIVQKAINFFEPPYKMKIKTVRPMKPEPVSEYNRMELLDEYINLQNRFIALLKKGHNKHVHLGTVKVPHPVFSFLKLSLSECFALAEVHQRRHHWQAEQTLKILDQDTQK